MKASGKIYRIVSLFSKEEKAEFIEGKSGVNSITHFEKLIYERTQKLIEDLRATNYWKVEESNEDSLVKYHITTADHITLSGSKRRGNNFICKNPLKGYILAFDPELQEFLEKYEG